jgi:peroxiredoxin Q/BCP
MSKKTRKKSLKPSARKTKPVRPVAATKASSSRAPESTQSVSAKTTIKPATRPAKTSQKPLKGKVPKSLARASGPAEGAQAPSFNLPRDGGDTVSLSDYAGNKLVLFFYPRADTPGCTKEAIEFTRLAKSFAESRTAVLGVSADTLKAQESFRNKHKLTIPLISDQKHEMLEAYGVWGEKSMYGRVFQGILRTTVLIGKDGKIIKIWRNVRVDGHAEEVLAAARSA